MEKHKYEWQTDRGVSYINYIGYTIEDINVLEVYDYSYKYSQIHAPRLNTKIEVYVNKLLTTVWYDLNGDVCSSLNRLFSRKSPADLWHEHELCLAGKTLVSRYKELVNDNKEA